ncbi:MAG: hypothetical protein ABGZ31_07040, partial [Roseibacillus sp.]
SSWVAERGELASQIMHNFLIMKGMSSPPSFFKELRLGGEAKDPGFAAPALRFFCSRKVQIPRP